MGMHLCPNGHSKVNFRMENTKLRLELCAKLYFCVSCIIGTKDGKHKNCVQNDLAMGQRQDDISVSQVKRIGMYLSI